ncbi:MAG: response regulator transcription factor [Solirubrobacterales bacterium]|nr:response regulator transcription factor [Solirubrobacterales bacterium]
MKRLLIVADRSMVVHTIRLALRQTAGFEVVGFVDGRMSVREALVERRPDVVLVDDLEDSDLALDRLREATELAPAAQLLLLTMRMQDAWLADVFEAGADAVLSKSMHPVSLGTTLREVVRGNVIHRYESPRRVAAEACPLTRRELEILLLAAEGHTNGQIARSLWVTEQTVKFHLSNTYRKLGVANRTEASRYAHIHALGESREPIAS